MADQQATPVAATPVESRRRRRPGPAGICLPPSPSASCSAAAAIAILLFAPKGWLVVLAVAIPIATHEVVRRLREAGYALPVIPLLIGGQAMIWLTWPYGTAGAARRVRRHDRGVHGLAAGRAAAFASSR